MKLSPSCPSVSTGFPQNIEEKFPDFSSMDYVCLWKQTGAAGFWGDSVSVPKMCVLLDTIWAILA